MRALVPLIALLAGCLAPAASDVPAPLEPGLPFPDPMGQDHDHGDIAAHAHAYQLERTAHHALDGDRLRASGAHALDLKGGFLFVATYGDHVDARGGVFIFDASDPLDPTLVGRHRFAGSLGGDRSMEATEDAAFVVLGTEALTCGGHINPFAPGLQLVDVRDKARPILVDHKPTVGVHSVAVHRIGEEDYVFARHGGENVYRIVREPRPMLEPIASLPIGHDSSVQQDPLTGRTLFYGATSGVEIWDVSDPATPEQLAVLDFDVPHWQDRWVHSVEAQIIDGRRILFASSEDGGETESMAWIIDATDLRDARMIANWTTGHPAGPALRWSMHNPRFMGDDVILAHYHGGVWALDLSVPESPQVIGQYMPDVDTGFRPSVPRPNRCGEGPLGAQFHDLPYVFDVEPGEGAVYAADMQTGLYVLRPLWAP